jgi:hypothetical protein
MTRESLLDEDWPDTIDRLGGTAVLKEGARKAKAFLRGPESEDGFRHLRFQFRLHERLNRATNEIPVPLQKIFNRNGLRFILEPWSWSALAAKGW